MDYIYHFFIFLYKKVYWNNGYMRFTGTTQRVERKKYNKVTHSKKEKFFYNKVLYGPD